jgi:hypothetical protein
MYGDPQIHTQVRCKSQEWVDSSSETKIYHVSNMGFSCHKSVCFCHFGGPSSPQNKHYGSHLTDNSIGT